MKCLLALLLALASAAETASAADVPTVTLSMGASLAEVLTAADAVASSLPSIWAISPFRPAVAPTPQVPPCWGRAPSATWPDVLPPCIMRWKLPW